MVKRKSLEEAQKIFEEHGFMLLAKEYKNTGQNLETLCPKGCIFFTSIDKLKLGCGCPYCKGNAKKTTEEVRKEFEKVGCTLLSNYTNAHTKMDVYCKEGHKYSISWDCFQQSKKKHHGNGCPLCGFERSMAASEKRKLDTSYIKSFIEKEGYKLLTLYKNCHTKMQALCPNGDLYTFTWNKFRKGCRCFCECGRERWTIEKVRELLKKDECTLLSSTLLGWHEHLRVRCNKGKKPHDYNASLATIEQGHRCPICFHKQSRAEAEIVAAYSFLTPRERDRKTIAPLELDLYFPSQRVAIEYCGLFWHCDQQKRITPSYHRNKMDLCGKQNIHLLTIFEDEYLNHKDICLSRINGALGVVKDKIFARKCTAKQITRKEAYEFLKRTHLQGPGSCKIAYGLFYNGKLVQVMTFGSLSRAHTSKGKKALEMKRLAGDLNTIIIGGASKIFKLGLQYAKQNNYDVIKSYCDLRWGTGNLYQKLGFTKTSDGTPSYHYTDGIKRWRGQNLAQNKKKTGITEAQAALQKGLWKIYDCGHQTWEYKV